MLRFLIMDQNNKILVKGKLTDEQTRCEHYHSALDIIAIKFKCCDEYYACIHCHEQCADHPARTWEKEERETKAILCGNCRYEMSINEYADCGYRCPNCSSSFNPKCRNHDHYYFEI